VVACAFTLDEVRFLVFFCSAIRVVLADFLRPSSPLSSDFVSWVTRACSKAAGSVDVDRFLGMIVSPSYCQEALESGLFIIMLTTILSTDK
jgi:hypothetical protein